MNRIPGHQYWVPGTVLNPLCSLPLFIGFYSKVSETGSKVSVTQTISPVQKIESKPI